jgi:hypothetical protein
MFAKANLSIVDVGYEFVVYNFGDGSNGASMSSGVGFRRIFVALQLPRVLSVNNSSYLPAGGRLCDGGASIVADLQSQHDKVAVDFFVEVAVAPGLYEIQPFFRRSGVYTLCLVLQAWAAFYRFRMTHATFASPLAVWNGDPKNITPASDASTQHLEPYSHYGPTRGRVVRGIWWETSPTMVWYMWRVMPGSSNNNNRTAGRGNRTTSSVSRNRVNGTAAPPIWCAAQPVELAKQCFTQRVSLDSASERHLHESLRRMRNGRRCGAGENDFRGGAWTRLLSCDGDLCTGDPLTALPSASEEQRKRDIALGGVWVFVSDSCTVRLYSTWEAWSIVDRHWLLNWGTSTLKEPATNFIEYVLQTSTRSSGPMEQLPALDLSQEPAAPGENVTSLLARRAAIRFTRFAEYRRWDVIRSRRRIHASSGRCATFRSTMSWGGCPSIFTPRPQCGSSMGLATKDAPAAFLSGTAPVPIFVDATQNGGDSSSLGGDSNVNALRDVKAFLGRDEQERDSVISSVTDIPSVILSNHFEWRHPIGNETSFILALVDTIIWLEAVVRGRIATLLREKPGGGCVRKPLLIWMSTTARVYDNVSTFCGGENERALTQHLAWKVEALLTKWRQRHIDFSRRRRRFFSCSGGDDSSYPFGDIIFMDRLSLTSPLSFGSSFGTGGVHYGATRGMCRTQGRDEEREIQQCMRNATADWHLMQWWLNVLDVLR